MRKEDLNLMVCPACGGALTLADAPPRETLGPDFSSGQLAWEGTFTCGGCGAHYPLAEGVACLGRLDSSWLMPLKEAESRICLTQRTLQEQSWEAGRQELHVEQSRQGKEQAEAMFEATLDFIDFSKRPRILDLGASECLTTERFAQLGARPVALDVDLPQMMFVSFKDIDTLPPEQWREPVSGRINTRKCPQGLSPYFTRTFANVGRLPFADGAFDVVFCRAVLHHLTDHSVTMREMARVVRPGGRMIFCAEPVRAIFEDEENLYDHCVEREEGMNERIWPLSSFTGPIARLGRDWMIHTWPMPPSPTLRRRLPWLADYLVRRVGPGARVRGWQRLALPFLNAAVTIVATRNNAPAPPPPVRPAPSIAPEELGRELAALAELFRVEPGQVAAGVEQLDDKLQALGRLRRRLLVACGEKLPSSLEPGTSLVYEMDRGWLDTAQRGGRHCRQMAREAWVTLAVPAGEGPVQLSCEVFSEQQTRWTVWTNGRAVGQATAPAQNWQTLHFTLPGEVSEPLVSVRLCCTAQAGEKTGSPQASPPAQQPFVRRLALERTLPPDGADR